MAGARLDGWTRRRLARPLYRFVKTIEDLIHV